MIGSFDSEVFLNKIQYLDNEEKNYILKLYKKYEFNNSKFKDEEEMIKKENKIYTVKGNILSEKTRIESEVYNILQKIYDGEVSDGLKEDIVFKVDEFNQVMKSLDMSKDNSIIYNKIKKDITAIQIKLGLNTKFFKAISELFIDSYNNLIVNDLENKKARKWIL